MFRAKGLNTTPLPFVVAFALLVHGFLLWGITTKSWNSINEVCLQGKSDLYQSAMWSEEVIMLFSAGSGLQHHLEVNA